MPFLSFDTKSVVTTTSVNSPVAKASWTLSGFLHLLLLLHNQLLKLTNFAPGGTVIEKTPKSFAMVPFLVPFSLIDALGNGLPLGSVTLPLTVVFCANKPVTYK